MKGVCKKEIDFEKGNLVGKAIISYRKSPSLKSQAGLPPSSKGRINCMGLFRKGVNTVIQNNQNKEQKALDFKSIVKYEVVKK